MQGWFTRQNEVGFWPTLKIRHDSYVANRPLKFSAQLVLQVKCMKKQADQESEFRAPRYGSPKLSKFKTGEEFPDLNPQLWNFN